MIREWPAARPARVITLESDGYYMVEVGGSTVPAYLSDRATDSALEIGSLVTVLTMVGGYEIVSAKTGASGSGGIVLGPELIANGGFESGALGERPDGWGGLWNIGFESRVVTSNDTPLTGSQCALVALDRPDDVNPYVRVSRSPSRIDPETVYRFTAYCSARITPGTTGAAAHLDLLTAPTEAGCDFFGEGAISQTVSTLPTPGEAWPLLSGDVTVPTGHTWFRPILRVTADTGANLTVRWDSVSLRQRLT